MSEGTKDLLEICFAAIQLLVVAAGTWWAVLRFRREGQHSPRIEFEIECEFLGPQEGARIATFSIFARNRGLVEQRFSRISLNLRGITEGSGLKSRDDGRLEFPLSVGKFEVIPDSWGYYFVRPGVAQRISFTAQIPANVRLLLARAAFTYQNTDDLHTAEKVFDTQRPTAAPTPG